MKKVFFVLVTLLLSAVLFGEDYTGTTIGPDVAVLNGKKLQWEAGSFDYFVMFKSLMTNNIRSECNSTTSPVGCDLPGNPEADTCLAQSTFTLTPSHVPEDAYVEAAYLVWTTSVDPSNTATTDNSAHLLYESTDGVIGMETDVIAPRVGTLGVDAANPGQQDFTFEGIGMTDYSGNVGAGYYTYRVDVTDFFTEIHERGREYGYKSDGLSLYGDYTVSGVDCTNNSQYISQVSGGSIYSSTVIAGWSLITVYRSTRVPAKMVYIYNGLGQYQGQYVNLGVSGFEFPDKPTVKMTLAVNEGDPGFAYATGCGGGLLGGGACPPEGLLVTGLTTPAEDLVLLQNECNPGKTVDSNGDAFNYSETYNSISSIYGWQDTVPTCVGGNPNSPDPDTLEYTMDVDTFRLDAESDPNFERQFKKGDNSMFIQIGVNRDVIYSNYMVLSVDTKNPKFDIPVNPNTPDGREKSFCSCSEQSDTICFTAPFYYAIKIQNWGDDLSVNVKVRDTLPAKVNYVPGTTEICRDWKSGAENACAKWEPIEDINGAFPLTEEYKVADILDYCDPVAQTCPETIMIRFKVHPKSGLAKNDVIENTAYISDDSGVVYKSNTSIPLRLTSGTCPSAALCENPDLTNCGGLGGSGCEKDTDCGEGKVCRDGSCIVDQNQFASNAEISIALGKNSPLSDSAIVIPAPSKDLPMGQFSVYAKSSEDNKNINFNSVLVNVSSKDSQTSLSDFRLVYDANGNGIFDADEKIVSAPAGINGNSVSFALASADTPFKVNTMHHFLILANASYMKESVPIDTTFGLSIESDAAFNFETNGELSVKVEETPLAFAEYTFEPTMKAFIFTKNNEPTIPAISQLNRPNIPMLQIRAKAIQHSNAIKRIQVKTTSKSVKFKEGISALRVYADVDNDASVAGEALLATAVPDEAGQRLDIIFDTPLSFAENQEIIFIIAADLSIPTDQMAQLEIGSGRVSLQDPDVDIVRLPVKSKEFWNKCAEGDNCSGDNGDDGGCAVSVLDASFNGAVLAALAAVLALCLLQLRKRGNSL
ncbi:hypothetical protein J5834_07375 [bacterium]|nr:hypothetical protein [bacterium]